jgi:hypothetical protein
MRIARKKKKVYKKLWFKRDGIKRYIIKSSIDKVGWECAGGKIVWGCMTRLKYDAKLK